MKLIKANSLNLFLKIIIFPLHWSEFNAPIFENDLNDSYDEHALLKKVPKRFKKNAAKLLKTFDEQPNEITWDSSGNIYIDEQVIPNADIFDIFPALFKKKPSKHAKGLPDLIQKLQSMGLSHLIMCETKHSKILSNQVHDRYFYETMMMFSAKVLQNAFEKHEIPKLEEEINRLFRSNAFNISSRTQFDEQRK